MSLYNVYVGTNPKSNIKFIDIGYISAYHRSLRIQEITGQPVIITGGDMASILRAIPMNLGLCFAYSSGFIVSFKKAW